MGDSVRKDGGESRVQNRGRDDKERNIAFFGERKRKIGR